MSELERARLRAVVRWVFMYMRTRISEGAKLSQIETELDRAANTGRMEKMVGMLQGEKSSEARGK